MQTKVLNLQGQEVGKITLADEVFKAEYNEALIHQAVVCYLTNQRQGTKSTLTRSEVISSASAAVLHLNRIINSAARL